LLQRGSYGCDPADGNRASDAAEDRTQQQGRDIVAVEVQEQARAHSGEVGQDGQEHESLGRELTGPAPAAPGPDCQRRGSNGRQSGLQRKPECTGPGAIEQAIVEHVARPVERIEHGRRNVPLLVQHLIATLLE